MLEKLHVIDGSMLEEWLRSGDELWHGCVVSQGLSSARSSSLNFRPPANSLIRGPLPLAIGLKLLATPCKP